MHQIDTNGIVPSGQTCSVMRIGFSKRMLDAFISLDCILVATRYFSLTTRYLVVAALRIISQTR